MYDNDKNHFPGTLFSSHIHNYHDINSIEKRHIDLSEIGSAYQPKVGDILFNKIVVVNRLNQMLFRISFLETGNEVWVTREEMLSGKTFDGSKIPEYEGNDLPWKQ